MRAQERYEVEHLCERMGYGAVLHHASTLWQEKGVREGQPSTGMMVGPHRGSTVECWHPTKDANGHCVWCCGCGWVTEHVALICMPAKED